MKQFLPIFWVYCLGATQPAWELGRFGGELTIAQRGEPKTLNPVTAVDGPSRDVIWRMMGDLITINRATQDTEPGLAERWSLSADGLHYTITLREGLRFSDGKPFTADDVVFSFLVYLDEKFASPQRDLLMVGGKPLQVVKLDERHVRVDLGARYAAAERLFDGVAMLPKHLLESDWRAGRLIQRWNAGSAPGQIAGMGPFRLREYRAGEYLVLERNPFYWKRDAAGKQLPYFDRIKFLFVPNEDTQSLRFAAGEVQILNSLGPKAGALLPPGVVSDLGASLDYTFLFFNLGAKGKESFRSSAFRQAISLAVDREAMVRLAYDRHASPLLTHVPPGNQRWFDTSLKPPHQSVEKARGILRGAGYEWDKTGRLIDPQGRLVTFSLLTSAGNDARMKVASIIQEDLRRLGMDVRVAPLELRSLIGHVLETRDFDACLMSLGGGDADPNSEMNVWLSGGSMHVWNPDEKRPATAWEAEIDALMKRQLETLDHAERRRLFDRVQQIEREQLPVIALLSPNVLVVAKSEVGNFRPAVMDHHTLWNAEYLYLRSPSGK